MLNMQDPLTELIEGLLYNNNKHNMVIILRNKKGEWNFIKKKQNRLEQSKSEKSIFHQTSQ